MMSSEEECSIRRASGANVARSGNGGCDTVPSIMVSSAITTVEQYLASLPPDRRDQIARVRSVVNAKLLPEKPANR